MLNALNDIVIDKCFYLFTQNQNQRKRQILFSCFFFKMCLFYCWMFSLFYIIYLRQTYTTFFIFLLFLYTKKEIIRTTYILLVDSFECKTMHFFGRRTKTSPTFKWESIVNQFSEMNCTRVSFNCKKPNFDIL